MEIKKGDWFKCVKAESCFFTRGYHYQSKEDESIENNYGINITVFDSQFKKLYTIQDFIDGNVAIKNDGTVDELNKVLKYSFPFKIKSSGKYRYYTSQGGRCELMDSTSLPTQSVKDFLVQIVPSVISGWITASVPKEKLKEQRPTAWQPAPSDLIGKAIIKASGLKGRITANVPDDPEKWQPKVGEKIEADIFANGDFVEAEYLATDETCGKWKYAVTVIESAHIKRRMDSASAIKPLRGLKNHKITKQEIADHLGIPVEQLEIVE